MARRGCRREVRWARLVGLASSGTAAAAKTRVR